MKENYSNTFFKKFWWVIPSLFLLLIISLGIYLYVFWERLCDPSAWASLISGIFTYIGASFLGIVVFYHSYEIERKHEHNEALRFTVDSSTSFDEDGKCIPYSDSIIGDDFKHVFEQSEGRKMGEILSGCSYVHVAITNLNKDYPLMVKIIGVYWANESREVAKCDKYVVKSNENVDLPLDFKDRLSVYIGIQGDILKLDYYKTQKQAKVFICFEMRDGLGKVGYFVIEATWGNGSYALIDWRYTEKEYKKLVKKNGHPIKYYRARKNV